MSLPASDGRRRLYDQGLNDYEIAERLGVRYETIRSWRYRNGLKNNFRKPRKYRVGSRVINKIRNYETTQDERERVAELFNVLVKAKQYGPVDLDVITRVMAEYNKRGGVRDEAEAI